MKKKLEDTANSNAADVAEDLDDSDDSDEAADEKRKSQVDTIGAPNAFKCERCSKVFHYVCELFTHERKCQPE